MAGAPRQLIVIGGPTASGKTRVAAQVARELGTEVISADSRQFYHAMRIGTARPTEAELLGVKHNFLGHLDLQETWSAGTFAREAESVLQELLARSGTAVMVGGSGLYIDAVLYGLDPLPPSDATVRARLQEQLRIDGLPALLEQLRGLDPDHWNVVDRNNPHRVLRALEVCLVSGKPYSALRSTPEQRTDPRIHRIAMDMPRSALYARIDSRVDHMIADGLVEEARALLPFRALNALNTVGYKEFFDHFDDRLSLTEAIALIKQHTRNYAKRQLTWLRRDERWIPMRPESSDTIARINALVR